MIHKISNTCSWLPYYLGRELVRKCNGKSFEPKHVYFCICDHFEPYRGNVDKGTARKRIDRWLREYPGLAERYPDSGGRLLKYTFFYPEEEYQQDDLTQIAELCHAGFGEVEIHLHHDNDNANNLRRTLMDFKARLHEKHGLLSLDKESGEVAYGFIHGNWALDNSRHDGRWCGVNDEISILQETGCYADFTLPSAPNDTQTRKVNSIYYAVGDRERPKSHDWGVNAQVGKPGKGLLMVQGPLCLNWEKRKYGFLPGIENGGLYGNTPPTPGRISSWIDAGVCVDGAPEHLFIKIYTHGAQDDVSKMLFDDGGFKIMLEGLKKNCEMSGTRLHFVSAREMVNVVLAIVAKANLASSAVYNFRYA
jgi:hypothetical protein